MADLHVAGEHDTPRTPQTITEALDSNARDVLAAMRLALARKLDAGDVSSNAIASSYKELRELDQQIRAIDAEDEQEAQRRVDSRTARRSFSASAL
jgi:hypothetical protein